MAVNADSQRTGSRLFVGRARERLLVDHLLRSAVEGHPSVVVASGPPGVGKTAFLRWIHQEAATMGAVVAYGSSSTDVGPTRFFTDLLTPVGGTPWMAAGPSGGEVDDLESALTRDVTDHVITLSRRRPLVVLVDDVHDLGHVSRQVLLALGASLDAVAPTSRLHVLVALTTRSPVESDGVLDRLLRLGITRDVPLVGLSQADVIDLVLNVGADPHAFPSLHADTRGLPLLVEATVDAGPERLRVRTLTDALKVRFEKADESARAILTLAAHLGEPWEEKDLLRVEPLPSERLRATLQVCADARLIEPDGSRWRFAHPLLRTKLLDEVDLTARRTTHLRIARALQAGDDESADGLVRIAGHLLEAGSLVPPAELADVAGRAGQAAWQLGSWEVAARLLEGATAAAADEPAAERAERHLTVGRAAYMAHDPTRAEHHLERALIVSREAHSGHTYLEAATVRARTRLGERPLALGQRVDLHDLADALQGIGLDPSAVVIARAVMAEALFVSGETDRALDLVATARRDADIGGASDGALGELELAEGIHRLTHFSLGRAEECFGRAERLAARSDDRLSEVCAQNRRTLISLLHGRVSEAIAGAGGQQERAAADGLYGEAAMAAALVAVGRVLAGGPDAASALEDAARLYRVSGFDWSAVVAEPVAAAFATRRGRVAPTWRSSAPVGRTSTVDVLSAVEAGDTQEARARTATATWRHGFRGPPSLANVVVLVALVEAGDLLRDNAMVAAARPALGALIDAGVLVIIGWPALVPRLLATVARWDGDAVAARRSLDHAAHLCRAHGLEAEMARIELELAQVAHLEDLGDAEVAAHLSSALRRFDDLGMLGWSARCDALARELSVPPLLGDGLLERERTLLTTDIVSSTSTNARLGDALYVEQLRVHNRLVRSRLDEFRGTEVKHTGDGFNACFDHPIDAARCALAIQADLGQWLQMEPELALQVRCGLATGQLVPAGRELFGLLQAETARVCSAAAPGEVLTSGRAASLLPPTGLTVTSLGELELRGFTAPVAVFRLETA